MLEEVATGRRYHEITLDEVARAAHVGKGTIYRYFKDKDDLFFQVATNGIDELCTLVTQSAPQNGSFQERLLGVCRQISRFFAARRELLRMMQGQVMGQCDSMKELRQRWLSRRNNLVQAVGAVLSEGIREQAIRSDVEPEVLASFLLGMLRTQARDMEGGTDGQDCRLLVELFLEGAGLANSANTEQLNG